jgi:hypothetical protein
MTLKTAGLRLHPRGVQSKRPTHGLPYGRGAFTVETDSVELDEHYATRT